MNRNVKRMVCYFCRGLRQRSHMMYRGQHIKVQLINRSFLGGINSQSHDIIVMELSHVSIHQVLFLYLGRDSSFGISMIKRRRTEVRCASYQAVTSLGLHIAACDMESGTLTCTGRLRPRKRLSKRSHPAWARSFTFLDLLLTVWSYL
jgi:hypothetical protein